MDFLQVTAESMEEKKKKKKEKKSAKDGKKKRLRLHFCAGGVQYGINERQEYASAALCES